MFEQPAKAVIAFDLDDTLYAEEDFLLSAYRVICERIAERTGEYHYSALVAYRTSGLIALDELLARHDVPFSIDELLEIYRYHRPIIEPRLGVRDVLRELKASAHPLVVITDGRSTTQRAKLKALGLSKVFDEVLISGETGAEKPSPVAFEMVMKRFPDREYVYVADNYAKDFIAPRALGWTSIALEDDGRNIHPLPDALELRQLPDHKITDIRETVNYVRN